MNASDIFQTTIQLIESHTITIVLVLLLLIVVLLMLRKRINSSWLNFKTRRCLERLGAKQASDLRLPDGLGGYFLIDRLILSEHGISLLMHNRYPGKIFCADHIDDWTQMLGKKSYRFKNPFYNLDLQVKAVSRFVPGVPVNGFVFFDHLAEFPKGHPERVIYPKRIPQELKHIKAGQVQSSVNTAWENLLKAAIK